MYVNNNFIKRPLLKKGSKIHIKKSHKGKFTDYCGGKVTQECISKGKNSSDPAVRKRATFAANARKWKHLEGGEVKINGINDPNYFKNQIALLTQLMANYLKSEEFKKQLQLQLHLQELKNAQSIGNTIGNTVGNLGQYAVADVYSKWDKENEEILKDPNKQEAIADLKAGKITWNEFLDKTHFHGNSYQREQLANLFGTYIWDKDLTKEQNMQNQRDAENAKKWIMMKDKDLTYTLNKLKLDNMFANVTPKPDPINVPNVTLNDSQISQQLLGYHGLEETLAANPYSYAPTVTKDMGNTLTSLYNFTNDFFNGTVKMKNGSKVHNPFHTRSILDDTGVIDRKTLKLKKHGK